VGVTTLGSRLYILCSYFLGSLHQARPPRERKYPVNLRTNMLISSRRGDYVRWKAFCRFIICYCNRRVTGRDQSRKQRTELRKLILHSANICSKYIIFVFPYAEYYISSSIAEFEIIHACIHIYVFV
jgi:hypothetical protein